MEDVPKFGLGNLLAEPVEGLLAQLDTCLAWLASAVAGTCLAMYGANDAAVEKLRPLTP